MNNFRSELFYSALKQAIETSNHNYSSVPDFLIEEVMRTEQISWNKIKDLFKNCARNRVEKSWDLSSWNFNENNEVSEHTESQKVTHEFESLKKISSLEPFIPQVDTKYVRWGDNSDTLERVISSKMFCPIYISGHSGNGKTVMVEQACAKAKRQYVRVQITPETDEDDIIGGFRLINGETVFVEGPAVSAMKAGAILMIDELDRGTNKIMCLQGVMEGKPILVKKTGEIVAPSPGFNIIATANTLGRGSDDGRYIAASVIDDAFLERFTIALEQSFPPIAQERKILNLHAQSYKINSENLSKIIQILVKWANQTRVTFANGGISDLISTRRLCHIIQVMSLYQYLPDCDKKAVAICVNRFDPETRISMIKSYEAIRPVSLQEVQIEETTSENSSDNVNYSEMDKMVEQVLKKVVT